MSLNSSTNKRTSSPFYMIYDLFCTRVFYSTEPNIFLAIAWVGTETLCYLNQLSSFIRLYRQTTIGREFTKIIILIVAIIYYLYYWEWVNDLSVCPYLALFNAFLTDSKLIYKSLMENRFLRSYKTSIFGKYGDVT